MASSSKKIKSDDLEVQFSLTNMRTSRSVSDEYCEMMKKYFKNENKLCDWILNLWKYAKVMQYDDIMEIYANVNLELIKENWDHEKYISCEFLINQLLKNDPSFFDFEVFIQPKKFLLNKSKIYDIITDPYWRKQNQPVHTTEK